MIDLAAIKEMVAHLKGDHGPRTTVMSPNVHAVIAASVKFKDRDWRRVKREMRKAWHLADGGCND